MAVCRSSASVMHRALEPEFQHPAVFAVRQLILALGVVQVVRVERPCFSMAALIRSQKARYFGRGVQRDVQPVTLRNGRQANVMSTQ